MARRRCCSACRSSPPWASPPMAFVALGGLSPRHRPAEDRAVRQLLPDPRRAAVHPDGQHHELGRHHGAHLRLRDRARRLAARRPVPRQHPGQRDLRRHVGLGGGGRRPASARSRSRPCGTRATTPRPPPRITAASATIGPIIPPSLPMVIYGVIGRRLDRRRCSSPASIPGLLMAGALMLMVAEVARRRNLPRHPFPGARDPLGRRSAAPSGR